MQRPTNPVEWIDQQTTVILVNVGIGKYLKFNESVTAQDSISVKIWKWTLCWSAVLLRLVKQQTLNEPYDKHWIMIIIRIRKCTCMAH